MCWGVAAGGCEPPDARTKLFPRAASALDHFSCFNKHIYNKWFRGRSMTRGQSTRLACRVLSVTSSSINNSVGADLVQDTGLMDSTPTAL